MFKDNSQEFLKKLTMEIERFLHRVSSKVVADATRIFDSGKANASGETRKNIRYEIEREAEKMMSIIGVGANVPYAIFKHEGTRLHFPPVSAIQRWVIKKGLVKMNNKPTSVRAIARGYFSGGIRKTRAINVMKESRSIAFAIARKIAKRGTQGLPFLRMALNQNVNWIANQIQTIKI